MLVSVEVVGRTLLTIDRAPATIEISPSDAARGFIEVPRAVLFHVRSNAANGYRLQFEPLAPPFRDVEIRWNSAQVTLGADAIWMTCPHQSGRTDGSLDVRLTLVPGTKAGTYEWPVRFDAEPR